MADDFTAAWAGVRAALIADAGVSALVGDRVLDHVPDGVQFPYVRLGRVQPVPDDTDGTEGALITLGLECFSRPAVGRIEAARICQAIKAALHRRLDAVAVAGFNLVDIEVQTWAVNQLGDGATWRGVVSLQVRLDA